MTREQVLEVVTVLGDFYRVTFAGYPFTQIICISHIGTDGVRQHKKGMQYVYLTFRAIQKIEKITYMK